MRSSTCGRPVISDSCRRTTTACCECTKLSVTAAQTRCIAASTAASVQGGGAGASLAAGGGPERGGGPTEREWYRPVPPYKETDWSMRNNTNYMETGVLSALQMTSAFPQVVLDNFYRKSRNSVEAGKKDAPYGYVIPGDQADPTRIAFVVNILRLQGIEVGRATEQVKVKEGTFPAGSFVIKRNQPYGRLAKILLEKQVYPDPSLRTYDDAAWTMGLMTHTKVIESADLKVLDVPVAAVDRFEPKGAVAGKAGAGRVRGDRQRVREHGDTALASEGRPDQDCRARVQSRQTRPFRRDRSLCLRMQGTS